MKLFEARVSNVTAAGLIVVGVIAVIAGFYFVASYQAKATVGIRTSTETPTAVSTMTVPTTATETVVSIATETEYLVSTSNTSLSLTPLVASVGTVLTLAGNGLPPNTQLYLTNCNTGISYAQFTSGSSGSIPPGVNITVMPMANPGPETGALIAWQIDDSRECGQGHNPVGTVKFVYEATMSLSSVAGPAGTTLTASANGLVSGGVYDIVFDYAPLSTDPDAYNGSVVGVINANSLGQGIANLTVPASTPMGLYAIGLVSTHNLDTMNPAYATALNIFPVFAIGGISNSGPQSTFGGSSSQQIQWNT